MEAKVVEVLAGVPAADDSHHFGRPFMSAYQLAIELHRLHPQVAGALGQPVGGADIGQRNSLAQYLARQLSGQIAADPEYPVEGAFISNRDVLELRYRATDGTELRSSLSGSGFELSMFRLRPQE